MTAKRLADLLTRYNEKFNRKITVFDDSRKVLLVGDLHGDLDTVLKVREMIEDYEKIIFLGDYVDRGEKDIETLIEVLDLKLSFPEKIILLRGNHEDPSMNLYYGFAQRLISIGFADWELLARFYAKLPYYYYNPRLKLFACHGGVHDFNWRISNIEDLNEKDIENILWSDFNWGNPEKDFDISIRGAGRLYGKNPLKRFMEINDLKYFVRGHEYFEEGYRIFKIDSRFLITIFSSNANGYSFVKKKVLEVNEEGYKILEV